MHRLIVFTLLATLAPLAAAQLSGVKATSGNMTLNSITATNLSASAMVGTDSNKKMVSSTLTVAEANALHGLASTRGGIIYRGAVGWSVLAPGTAGQVVTSNGAGSDPSYQDPAGGGGGLSAGAVMNAHVNASAAIDRTKLAAGSINHVLINSSGGVMSSEAYLSKSRGGAGGDMSSVFFPSSGTIAILSDFSTLAAINDMIADADITPTSRTITANNGLTGGGDLSANRTVGLAAIADLRVMANVSGGSAVPIANTLSAIIDAAIGNTQGNILYRNGTIWTVLAPGTSGQVLQSGGAAANPSWTTLSGTGDVVGPASATDNSVPRYDSTTGKLLQGSGVTIDDSNNISTPGTISTGTSGTGSINVGSAGAIISTANNGDIKITGNGNGTDEDFTINLNSANVATVSSSTGLATWDFSSFNFLVATASANDNDTSAASTAYVQAELTAYASDTVTFSNKTTDNGTSMATDDTLSGFVRSGRNNSGGVTQWDAVYLNSSSQWVLADANGSGTYPCRGLATTTASTGNATTVVTRGTVRNDAWAWTPGGTIYLSTTAGGLTQTAPSTTGDKVQVIGYALDADTIALEISPDYGTAP